VADVTSGNPNVTNEIGFARGKGIPVVLICGGPPEELPFNIRSLGIFQYEKGQDGLAALEAFLTERFRPLSALREMLVPSAVDTSSPFVIAASPLAFRRARARAGGFKSIRRTSSDHVGVRGILRCFATIYGPDRFPEVLDPEDFADGVVDKPMNLYCIASPKSNVWSGHLLARYAEELKPEIRFHADPHSEDLRHLRVALYVNKQEWKPDGWDYEPDDHFEADFGVIVRGPKPGCPANMMTILAGRSALGTEAACTAFTTLEHVATIRQRLEGLGISLDDFTQPFLVLVSMERDKNDPREARQDTLQICNVRALSPVRGR
jgi:hypothetical protein